MRIRVAPSKLHLNILSCVNGNSRLSLPIAAYSECFDKSLESDSFLRITIGRTLVGDYSSNLFRKVYGYYFSRGFADKFLGRL
jgi:hypothetical protein